MPQPELLPSRIAYDMVFTLTVCELGVLAELDAGFAAWLKAQRFDLWSPDTQGMAAWTFTVCYDYTTDAYSSAGSDELRGRARELTRRLGYSGPEERIQAGYMHFPLQNNLPQRIWHATMTLFEAAITAHRKIKYQPLT